MTKQIAYLIVDNGMDGRAPTDIIYASFNETERDAAFNNNKNKAYLSKQDAIVDVELEKKRALSKLDGLNKLVLNIM